MNFCYGVRCGFEYRWILSVFRWIGRPVFGQREECFFCSKFFSPSWYDLGPTDVFAGYCTDGKGFAPLLIYLNSRHPSSRHDDVLLPRRRLLARETHPLALISSTLNWNSLRRIARRQKPHSNAVPAKATSRLPLSLPPVFNPDSFGSFSEHGKK